MHIIRYIFLSCSKFCNSIGTKHCDTTMLVLVLATL
uniref:Uncharacterized protein n=1 Tax=Arundo donax TaxID=35708 RepID=A0A0A9B071_ARUDO